MSSKTHHAIRNLTLAAGAVVIGAGLLATPAAAGDWSTGHSHRHYDRAWSQDRETTRLLRRVLNTFFNERDRYFAHLPAKPNVHRVKHHRRNGKSQVCRTKTKIVIDDYGYRTKIVRKHCRDTRPNRRYWQR